MYELFLPLILSEWQLFIVMIRLRTQETTKSRRKPPKTAETAKRRPYHISRTALSYELLLPLILIRMATFHINILIPNSKANKSTPKTSQEMSYELHLQLILENGHLYCLFAGWQKTPSSAVANQVCHLSSFSVF